MLSFFCSYPQCLAPTWRLQTASHCVLWHLQHLQTGNDYRPGCQSERAKFRWSRHLAGSSQGRCAFCHFTHRSLVTWQAEISAVTFQEILAEINWRGAGDDGLLENFHSSLVRTGQKDSWLSLQVAVPSPRQEHQSAASLHTPPIILLFPVWSWAHQVFQTGQKASII